ncbi:hypothetical protein F5141DRAFT_327838 [Pisolithus sp. B1]|nr:hypothetical protein F5141DRAFT_327838 [Pisolithus sp. B1]
MQTVSDTTHSTTPDSVVASTPHHSTSTIDDLTLALNNLSGVSSPEPLQNVLCCCGQEECEATKDWLALKSKLEGRLILSAEVGSALLRRHEAYVRQHESSDAAAHGLSTDHSHGETARMDTDADVQTAELIQENAALQKRLTQALLNNEVSEASNKDVLHKLEEARSTVSKLTAHHARSVALDAKLSTVLQENDDIRQECDCQSQRAKLAEARLAAFSGRADKLQAEVRRLQSNLEARRVQRLESSESLLQEVRMRLEELQSRHMAHSTIQEGSEISQALESLVMDNEALRADNEELHKLLAESREDLQALRAQTEQYNIVPPIRVDPPSKHTRTTSGPSSLGKDSLLLSSVQRSAGVEPKCRRGYVSHWLPTFCPYLLEMQEPLTPETSFRPLSPTDSLFLDVRKNSSPTHPYAVCSSFPTSLETDDFDYAQRSLLATQATKAVQTDQWLTTSLTPHFVPCCIDQPSPSLHDGRSDSSSLFDGQGSHMSGLLERVLSLLHRMSQADALTLTSRLKRQHLLGADVKHLSRTTVSNILAEIPHLRAHYRAFLEDEKMALLCTRRDLRALFKLIKDAFDEMGQMRVTLNDIILEPSIAGKVSEMALDPVKAEAMDREQKSSGSALGSSWMSPFTKLFGTSLCDLNGAPLTTSPSRRSGRGRVELRHPRPIPKIGPALAASTTTVNVEFSGTGAGRSVATMLPSHSPTGEGGDVKDKFPGLRAHTQTSATTPSVRNVMGIFAGAPCIDDPSEPWVVLPRAPRRVQSTCFGSVVPDTGPATIGRSALRKRHVSQMSRDVDAVLDAEIIRRHDSEGDDIPGPLPPERKLHRRGLSDSSIHSTLANQADDFGASAQRQPMHEQSSVLRTISRTVLGFKQAAAHTISGVANTAAATSLASSFTGSSALEGKSSSLSEDTSRSRPPRSSTPSSSLAPRLTSWAAGGTTPHPPSLFKSSMFDSSLREEPVIHRHLGRESQGRDI